jgi:hypothetical protein
LARFWTWEVVSCICFMVSMLPGGGAMALNYLCERWQGLLEMMVNLTGNGYHYININYIPDNKKDKYFEIDRKIINKYKLKEDSKDKKYQRKKKGLSNFRYLRWQNIVVIMHTDGHIIIPKELEGSLFKRGKFKNKNLLTEKAALSRFNQYQVDLYKVEADDDFTNIKRESVFIRIGSEVVLELLFFQRKGQKKGTFTFRMSKKMYRNKKAELLEFTEAKAKNKVIYSFNMLNNLPAFGGIVSQKIELKSFILKQSRKYGLQISYNDLNVNWNFTKEKKIFIMKKPH